MSAKWPSEAFLRAPFPRNWNNSKQATVFKFLQLLGVSIRRPNFKAIRLDSCVTVGERITTSLIVYNIIKLCRIKKA